MASKSFMKSFQELAQVFGGDEAKMGQATALASWDAVVEKAGQKAAALWAFLTDQEACKRSGPRGWIVHDLSTLKEATGWPDAEILAAVMKLVNSGFARLTDRGQKVKPA